MKQSDNRFHNIYFDRFLDVLLTEKPPRDYMHLLDSKDRKALLEKDEFIAEANLDEKLMLLTKMGHSFALVIGTPQKQPSRPFLNRIITIFFKCLSWKRYKATQVMRKRFFFVLTDMDFVKGLKLASNVYNSPAGATMAGYAHTAGKFYTYKTESQKLHVQEANAAFEIDKLIMNVMSIIQIPSAQAAFKGLNGINDRQYIMLAILSKYRECTVGDLSRLSGGMRWISLSLKGLLEKRLIEKKSVTLKKDGHTKIGDHYWITGLGEQVLIKARNFFIQHI